MHKEQDFTQRLSDNRSMVPCERLLVDQG